MKARADRFMKSGVNLVTQFSLQTRQRLAYLVTCSIWINLSLNKPSFSLIVQLHINDTKKYLQYIHGSKVDDSLLRVP